MDYPFSPSLVFCMATACFAATPPDVVNGWSVFEEPPGAVVVYVSDTGSDANPGTINRPKATVQAGYAALREGQADWLLLERGGSWDLSGFIWSKSGPLADDAGWMRLGAYGDENSPRPRLNSGTQAGLVISPGYRANRPLCHFAATDLHLVAQGRLDSRLNAPAGTAGLQTVAVEYAGTGYPLQHVVLENVKIEGYGFGYVGSSDVEDLRLRRCIITEIFSPGANGTHGSGILSAAFGLFLEENVFYRIQHPDMPGVTEISVFAHSAYITAETRNVVARGNIIIKTTEGFMQRAGGVYERNVSAFNDIAYLSGQAWGVVPTPGGVTATIQDNLLLNAASSVIMGNVASGTVMRNLIVRGPESAVSFGISLMGVNPGSSGSNIGVHNTRFEDNVISGDFTYSANQNDTQHFSGLTLTNNRVNLGAITTSVAGFTGTLGLSGDIDTYGRDLIGWDRANFGDRHLSITMINYYRSQAGLPALGIAARPGRFRELHPSPGAGMDFFDLRGSRIRASNKAQAIIFSKRKK